MKWNDFCPPSDLFQTFVCAHVWKKEYCLICSHSLSFVLIRLLFDFGKLEAIESNYKSNLSKAGNLLGHVALGRDIIISAAKKIRKFPAELLLQIEHILLTQQSYYEGGRQISPMFKEALVVSMITSMDSRMSIMKKIIEEDKDNDDFTSQYNFFKTTIC